MEGSSSINSAPSTIATAIDEDLTNFDEEEDNSTDADNWWRNFPSGSVDKGTHAEILKLGNKVGRHSSSLPPPQLSQVLMFLLLLGNSVESGEKVLLFSQVPASTASCHLIFEEPLDSGLLVHNPPAELGRDAQGILRGEEYLGGQLEILERGNPIFGKARSACAL
jgi:hypothetical protein